MARVSEITEDGGNAELKEFFAQDCSLFGGVLNPTRILAHCPPILRAARQLGAAIGESGQLPPSLPPLVYVRVASLNGCPF